MPQIIFKGVPPELVKTMSTELLNQLSLLMNTPKDWFTLECMSSAFYFDGKQVNSDPIVEIRWFCRGQDVKNKTALTLHNLLNHHGFGDTVVTFMAFAKEDYFENGEHF